MPRLSRIGKQCLLSLNMCAYFREREVVQCAFSEILFCSSFKEEKAFASGDKFLQTRGSKSLFCVPQCHTVELKNCLSQLALHGMTRRGSEWPERASYKMTNHGLVVQQSSLLTVGIGLVWSMLAWHGTDGTYGI